MALIVVKEDFARTFGYTVCGKEPLTVSHIAKELFWE